mmetsp:Transcript_66114/g.162755  ORF Transcript_66114/g.162755 Transcript_66114/m.162755 type:complete len:253 (+) Transcript_66114:1197-1955(+)
MLQEDRVVLDAVNVDRPLGRLRQAEHRHDQRALARARAPDDANLLARLEAEAAALEDGRQVRQVGHVDVVEHHSALGGPARGGHGALVVLGEVALGLEVLKREGALDRCDLGVDLAKEGDRGGEEEEDLDAVGHHQARARVGDAAALEEHGEEDGAGHEDDAEHVDAHGDPVVAVVELSAGAVHVVLHRHVRAKELLLLAEGADDCEAGEGLGGVADDIGCGRAEEELESLGGLEVVEKETQEEDEAAGDDD